MSIGKGGLTKSTAELTLDFEKQITNTMTAFRAVLDSLVDQLAGSMARRVYEVVAEGATEIGNVVSAAENQSLPDAILQMLDKLEFGVDEDGNVTLPSLHSSPELFERMVRETDALGQEFRIKVEAIKTKKSAEALKRESIRLSRYKGSAVK